MSSRHRSERFARAYASAASFLTLFTICLATVSLAGCGGDGKSGSTASTSSGSGATGAGSSSTTKLQVVAPVVDCSQLILWHGWTDQHISPLFTIAYYEAMQSTMAASAVEAFARLYLVPGVSHCGGGEGNPNIDLVSRVTAWVEQGATPNDIMTYQTAASCNVTASRPVYPYPAIAKYKGSGDWHDGANYVIGAPLYNVATAA